MACVLWLAGNCLLIACGPRYEWEDLRGSAEECLVITFEPDVETRQVQDALSRLTRASEPHSGGGWPHREGVGAVVLHSPDSPVAYEVCFSRDATSAQKEVIRDDFEAESTVLMVEDLELVQSQ